MAVRNLIPAELIASILVSCASNPVGEIHPELARNACSIGWEHCSMGWSKDNWALEGRYTVDKTEAGRFLVHGQINVDTSRMLSAYTYSRVAITFYFFHGDEIVARLHVTAKGKVNEYNEFSKTLKTDQQLDSSYYRFTRINVSEVPL